MTRAIEPMRLRDLLTLLGQIERLHNELAVLVKAKVDAMKCADMRTLQQHTEQEQNLVKRIQEREGLRHQLMDVIGEQLGLSPRSARTLTVSQLVSRIPKRQQNVILESAERLKDAVSKVARANHVAGMVARELVDHLRRVFAAVRPKGEHGTGYTGEGEAAPQSGNRIFEAVG